MLDINFIRENKELVKKTAENKLVKVDVEQLLEADEKRRKLQKELDDIGAARNRLNEGTKEKPSPEQIEKGKKLKEKYSETEEEFKKVDEEFLALMEEVPNIPTEDTPVGKSENENAVLRKVGEIPEFSFKPKEHWELGKDLGIVDFERASKISGSRFAYLKDDLAMMEFALIQHVLGIVTNEKVLRKIIKKAGLEVSSKPFTPVIPPVMVRPEVMKKMGRLEPKEERYHIPSDNVYLVGSAEHSIGSMHMDEVLPENELPKRYIAFSTSFRREAGSYGKDVRGLIRMHQFDKLEMESFTLPENSLGEHELMIAIQEYFMQSLELPYQAVLKCTADMGAPDARAVDIETWMPGQNKYRETHTADLMTDFQARRLKTKVKRQNGKSEFVHMNDATACAIGRTLVAIIENYQKEDGSIGIPKVLQKYIGKRSIIKPN